MDLYEIFIGSHLDESQNYYFSFITYTPVILLNSALCQTLLK